MTKRNLGDMILKEATKPTEPQELAESKASNAKQNSADNANANKDMPDQSEFESTIGELQNSLEQAKQKEALLQQEIVELRADLDTHKQTVEKLKGDFAEAKDVILKLTDAANASAKAITSERPKEDKSQSSLKTIPYHSIQRGAVPIPESGDLGSWLL
jgi:chromosome segregation ATPase